MHMAEPNTDTTPKLRALGGSEKRFLRKAEGMRFKRANDI